MSTPVPLCGNYKEDFKKLDITDECPLCKKVDPKQSIEVGFHPSRIGNLYIYLITNDSF